MTSYLQTSGFCLWFTGLPASGKSTTVQALSLLLDRGSIKHDVLDGDEMRRVLSPQLGYSRKDRIEHISRIAWISSRIVKYGGVALVSCISPYTEMRSAARAEISKEGKFLEAYIDTPLSECEKRDPKGLYRRARAGEISDFTGVSDAYECPLAPEITLNTINSSVEQNINYVLSVLMKMGILERETT